MTLPHSARASSRRGGPLGQVADEQAPPAEVGAREVEPAAVSGERQDPHPLHPGRQSHVAGLVRRQAGGLAGGQVVEPQLAEAGLVAGPGEPAAVGGELGLADRPALAAGELTAVSQDRRRSRREAQPPEDEAARVPGHAGQIVLHPGQLPPAGMPGRLHVEVGPVHQGLGPVAAGGVDHGEAVVGPVAVHVHDPAAVGGGRGVRRLAEAGGQPAHAAPAEGDGAQVVPVLDEDHPAAAQGELAAAVEHPRLHGVAPGQLPGGGLPPAAAEDHRFVAAPLEPRQGAAVAVEGGRAHPHAAAGVLHRHGALPQPEGPGLATHTFSISSIFTWSGPSMKTMRWLVPGTLRGPNQMWTPSFSQWARVASKSSVVKAK